MIFRTSDVVVVGGGPAGLTAALALRKKGLEVLVADSLHPPIDKACGEGLMPDSREELAKLGVELSPEDGAEFHGIHFANRGHDRADCVTAEFRKGPGLGVRRLHLHQRMIDSAQQAGVQLAWASPVQLRPGGEVRIHGEKLNCRYIIGADGQSSRVRTWAGLDKGTLLSRRFGFRAHYPVRPWSRNVEVHWGQRGQAYITPVGENEICVAVITREPGLRISEVLDSIPFVRERLAGVDCTSRERGAVTTTRRLRKVAAGNVALIGDASGSADAITGEGMAMAFRQALLLAESISADNLKLYRAGHPGILRMPQTMARIMLLMDRFPLFRNRAMGTLASEPDIFARMLDVHLGEESLQRFVRQRGLHLGWRLLAPATAKP